ncbi:MAG: type II toxin-antitoxin system RelE/ParE family toxin [Candidatus Aenigmarchaeota archaeon]|nr:type II toxin-antitoxin system RelE/ParE family toxin [Candidatus Aenigmarchaeota archaeon]
MEILFSDSFKRDFRRIKDRELRERIIKTVKKLAEAPESGKPLRYGFKGHRRLVVKPFRIIYRFDGKKIIVNCFEHRKNVYRRHR